jgi:Phage capsid protein
MAIMGVTETAAVGQQEIMANMVQQYLQAAAMFPQRVQTFQVANGIKSCDIPRAGGLTVGDKAENTAVTAQVITWAVDNLPLSKHRVIQVNLEKIAGLQSKVSQELQIAERAGLDLAYDTDLRIVNEFYSSVSLSAPDHCIAFANSAGANTLAGADILAAKLLLDLQKVPQDGRFLAVDPTGYSELLAIDGFIRYDALGAGQNPNAIRTGVVGTIFGFEVFMSNAVTADQHIAFHKSALAYGVQESVTYDTDKDLPNLATLHSFDQIYGVKGLDAGKRHVVIGKAGSLTIA